MKTEIEIIDYTAAKRTSASVVDFNQIRKSRVRGTTLFKGTAEFIVDFSNDVEVSLFHLVFQ
jgi:hypothetical protein